MGPFLLVLLVSSGVSVFSLAPEPSDDEVSSTSSLVSRLSQVKTVGKERRGRHQYFLFYDTPPSPSPSPTTESQPLIVHHHYHNYTTDNTASGGGGTTSPIGGSTGGGGASVDGGSSSGGSTGGGAIVGGGGGEAGSDQGSTGSGAFGGIGGSGDESEVGSGGNEPVVIENGEGSGEENQSEDGSAEGSGDVLKIVKQNPGTACECGVLRYPTSTPNLARIAGGVETRPFQYRWMVTLSLDQNGGQLGNNPGHCGGTLIADQWVLTAAHCVYPDGERVGISNEGYVPSTFEWLPTHLSVVVGEHLLWENGAVSRIDPSDRRRIPGDRRRRKVRKVAKVIAHEGYEFPKHDIALLKLRIPLNLNSYPPACLPSNTTTATGLNGTVAGWGFTDDHDASNHLMSTVQTIISNQECNRHSVKPTADMLCAITPAWSSGFKDACPNDSGGPLTVDFGNNRRHTLMGVVSWGATGHGCTQPDESAWSAGVYSSVPHHVDWIREKIEEDGDGNFCDS